MDHLDQIKQMMADHNKADDHRFGEQGADIKDIKGDIKTIKENHLQHMEIDMAQVKTDLSWLKKSYWVVVVASVGALIGAIINLVAK